MVALSSKTASRPGARRIVVIILLGAAAGLALVAVLKLYVWRQEKHFREIVAAAAEQSRARASWAKRGPNLAEGRLQQGEQKLRTAGKEGSWKYAQDRMQRLPAAKSPERWETYDLLEYYCNNVADKGTLRFEAKKGMADVLYFEGRLDEEKAMFQEALEYLGKPKDRLLVPVAIRSRATMMFEHNDPALAVGYVELLLSRCPESPEVLAALQMVASYYEKLRMLPQALDYYRKLKTYYQNSKWDPRWEKEAWFSEATALANLQRPAEAVKVLDAFGERFKDRPEWVASALRRSATMIDRENPTEALARCRRGLALVPADSPMARELREELERVNRKFLDDLGKAL